MKRANVTSHALAGALLAVVSTMAIGACSGARNEFDNPDPPFANEQDAEVPTPPECKRRCTIDFRSVIDCDGDVIEKCSEDQACGAGSCQEPCAAAAAEPSSIGCDFYMQRPMFGGVSDLAPGCYAGFVLNMSTKPATVSMEFKGQSLDLSHALYRAEVGTAKLEPLDGPIPPGESAVLFLADKDPDAPLNPASEAFYVGCPSGVVPATSHSSDLPGFTGIGSALRVKTSAPVSLSTSFPFGGSASFLTTGTLVLPVSSWGTENILISPWETQGPYLDPGAQILAAEDDTEVTIVPKRAIQDGDGVKGGPANVPISYRLNKGEYLQLVQSEELTGSYISSNKPTSIVGIHAAANVPSNSAAADVLASQIPAFEHWGSEYAAAGYHPRALGESELMIYRIVAARDGTRLDYDPVVPAGAPITLEAGDAVNFEAGVGEAFVVRSQDPEHPIYLAAYMTGSGLEFNTGTGGLGDPEFVNVVPSGQYLNRYSFYADPSYSDTSLVLIRKKDNGKFEDVSVECAGKLTDWKPIGARGQYEFTRVKISTNFEHGDAFDAGTCDYGLVRTWSDGPFTATIWGMSFCVSYAYPGAMAARKLVSTPLRGPR